MFGDEPTTRLTQSSHKLVLYPQGHPPPGARAKCDMLVHHCGGDAQRTFDLKRRSAELSLKHALRVRAFQDAGRAALCVVHDTSALGHTVSLRAAFEEHLPIAATAVWAIFWNPSQDPDFLERAQRQGTLIGDLTEGAIWRHASGAEFLVLCPDVNNFQRLAEEAAVLSYTRRASRRRRPSGEHSASKVSLAS